MSESFNNYEQAVEHITRQIRDKKNKILDDFFNVYAAHLSHLEDFSVDDICLVEQEGRYINDKFIRTYWFEHKPKFKVNDE